MQNSIDALTAAVAANTDAVNKAVAALAAAPADVSPILDALTASINANNTALAAALAPKTPAA
jgi:non-homologous end joining protein Ku